MQCLAVHSCRPMGNRRTLQKRSLINKQTAIQRFCSYVAASSQQCLPATTNRTLLHRLPCEEAEASLHAIFVSPNACSEIPICPFMFVISICSRISSYRSLISSTITVVIPLVCLRITILSYSRIVQLPVARTLRSQVQKT